MKRGAARTVSHVCQLAHSDVRQHAQRLCSGGSEERGIRCELPLQVELLAWMAARMAAERDPKGADMDHVEALPVLQVPP